LNSVSDKRYEIQAKTERRIAMGWHRGYFSPIRRCIVSFNEIFLEGKSVKQSQKMGPSEALVETLAANGVTHVFGIVGSAFMDALDIFPAAGIKFVPVAHEQGAIHMVGMASVLPRTGPG